MKTTKRVGANRIIVLLALFMLVFSISGTYAFLTAKQEKTNTFTFGKVAITLTEGEGWDNNSNPKTILPGDTVEKAPVVTVTEGPAYVFMTVSKAAHISPNAIGAGWIEIDNRDTRVVYAYGTSTAMTEVAKNSATSALFASVTADANYTGAQDDETEAIVVKAYAIQTSNVGTTPSEVWSKITE